MSMTVFTRDCDFFLYFERDHNFFSYGKYKTSSFLITASLIHRSRITHKYCEVPYLYSSYPVPILSIYESNYNLMIVLSRLIQMILSHLLGVPRETQNCPVEHTNLVQNATSYIFYVFLLSCIPFNLRFPLLEYISNYILFCFSASIPAFNVLTCFSSSSIFCSPPLCLLSAIQSPALHN